MLGLGLNIMRLARKVSAVVVDLLGFPLSESNDNFVSESGTDQIKYE